MAKDSVTVTVRLQAWEKRLLQSHALSRGLSLSAFMKQAAPEKIEDETDLKTALEAKAELEANPKTVPAGEIEGKYL